MEKQINIKKIIILLAIILGIIAITVITTICINKSIISKQMKTATNAITINSDSKLYKHAKESKKAGGAGNCRMPRLGICKAAHRAV